MKIHELEIRNIRGILHYKHNFGGENAVILGPNGTGKSSVLDAIDFLLTGDISRLRGDGTREITVRKHGLNINQTKQPQLGYVEASVSLPGHSSLLRIKRCVNQPDSLVYLDGNSGALNEPAQLAEQGQHMLTRRQMLDFISIPPKNRAERVQALLSLEIVENVRRNLVSVRNKLKSGRDRARLDVEASQSKVASILGLDTFEEPDVLHSINACRTTLGASQLSCISDVNVMKGVTLPERDQALSYSPSLLIEHAKSILLSISSRGIQDAADLEQKLRLKIHEIRSDTALLRLLSQQQLLELGLKLADGDYCPLCDKQWNNADLNQHLENKIARAETASRILDEISSLEDSNRSVVNDVLSNLEQILESGWEFEVSERDALQQWKVDLESLRTYSLGSLENYPIEDVTSEGYLQLLAPQSTTATIRKLKAILERNADTAISEESPEAVAYARLVNAESALSDLVQLADTFDLNTRTFDRITALEGYYIRSRDQVLGEVYDSISGEFARLYGKLHPDEQTFEAKLLPQNAGLNLQVDFHGRGLHPPNALHSEGHQDSMGLCLFLVLSERLSGEALQFMLLDDVISSIDVGHRRDLATLLVAEYPERQVIVTTHDPDWNKMLVREGFASSPNLIRFDRWDVDAGVIHTDYQPDWDLVDEHLQSERLREAASVFRNWAERFFKQLCHNLRAPVPFDIDGRYTLDNVSSPGLSRFRDLLKRATKSARKTGNCPLLASLQSLEAQRENVYKAMKKEDWLFNRVIHDNDGVHPTSREIQNAVIAMKDFYTLMHCEHCNAMLQYSQSAHVVFCKCRHILWSVKK